MMPITYRPAVAADLVQTHHIFVRATNHLAAGRNLPLIPTSDVVPSRSLAFRRHVLAHDAARFWVAMQDEELIGFGAATLRGHLWYLAALHVLPAFQGQGVGQGLLRRCMGTPEHAGALVRTVIADSINPVSNALYARHGLFATIPLITLHGPVPTDPAGDLHPECMAVAVRGEPAALAHMAALDRWALGVTREKDHRFWLAQPDLTAYLIEKGGRTVAYAYVSRSGGIGPVATRGTELMPAVLAFCLGRLGSLGAATGTLKVPGVCHPALTDLLRRGFRYDAHLVISSSHPFGELTCYLPSAGDALF